MDFVTFSHAMRTAFILITPAVLLAIYYDVRHDAPWRPALKWALILFVLLAFTGSIGYAQMVSYVGWCGQIEGFWWYAGGCFLPGM